MSSAEYSNADRCRLLGIARASMTHGVQTGRPLIVGEQDLTGPLAEIRASFVTLRLAGELRGCTGSLVAVQPLARDVAHTACATALSDPRFYPVRLEETAEIRIEISVLSPLEPFPVRDEADLLARLEPDVDGLVLEIGVHRATFLPKVWEQLPSAEAFVGELKRKAGLPRDYWSSDIAVSRYRTETFAEPAT